MPESPTQPDRRLDALLQRILAFREARDWKQFHSPKELAAGLAIEAAELQELFLWKDAAQVTELVSQRKTDIAHELADIAWFLLLLAKDLDIDLAEAIESKLAHNEAKYPVEKARGNNAKYTEL